MEHLGRQVDQGLQLEGGQVTAAASSGEEDRGDNVVDLMSALQASVDRAKSGGEEADEKPSKQPAKKAAKKTTTTKKSAK